MSGQRFSKVRYPDALVLARGWAFGTMGGAATGALVGTCIIPVIGTAYGFVVGLVIGLAIAVPCALTVMFAAPWVVDARMAAVTGALAGMVWSVVAIVGFQIIEDSDELFADTQTWVVAGTLLSALVGAWVAPRATFRRALAYEPVVPNHPRHAGAS